MSSTPSSSARSMSPGRNNSTVSPLDDPSLLIPSLCRHFALRGTCRFKDDCHYSHVLPDDCSDWNEACQRIPCPHYQRRICRYASMCRLAHCVVIEDHKDNNEATSDVNEAAPCPPSVDDASVSVEALAGLSIKDVDHDSNEMFCGICLEPLGQMRNDQGEIKHIRKKFGLLSSCDHMFCIHCLRTWRHQQKKNASNNASSDRTSIRVRACPACRQASDFVVPSDRFCTGEEKRQVVSSYQARLSCTPCKRFNGKLGSCPFGRDCFYAHWNRETGHDMKSQDKTKLELWKDKQDRKRLKEQRRRLQQRSSTAGLLAGISSQEIGVMHDLLYLSSIDRLLSTVAERNQGDHVGDDNDNDLLAFDPRLMQVLRGHRHGRSLEMLRRLYSSDRPTGNT